LPRHQNNINAVIKSECRSTSKKSKNLKCQHIILLFPSYICFSLFRNRWLFEPLLVRFEPQLLNHDTGGWQNLLTTVTYLQQNYFTSQFRNTSVRKLEPTKTGNYVKTPVKRHNLSLHQSQKAAAGYK